MNKLQLRNSLLATLVVFVAYAPTSSAIVKHQSVKQAFATGAPAVTVNFSDLDVAHAPGVETLYQRLRTAAKAVCGAKDTRNLNQVQEWRTCYKQALDGAVEKVNIDRLDELHNS